MKGKRWGDRKDAKLIRKTDSMHFIMGLIYPNRADNEAFISKTLDLTEVERYLAEKNSHNPEYKYNVFQFIVSAFMKCVVLRPKLNRFYANGNYYQRNDLTAAFVIKKKFEDKSEEGLAVVRAKNDWSLEDVHQDIYRQIHSVRGGKNDASTDVMNTYSKLPRFISKTGIRFIRMLDKHGKVPAPLIATDPFYSTCVFSNLGSIKLNSGYHHLTNWGTTSLFCTVGEIKKRPFHNEDGTLEFKSSVDIGLTADERIADGFYFSRTIALLKKLFEHPELLDEAFEQEVDY